MSLSEVLGKCLENGMEVSFAPGVRGGIHIQLEHVDLKTGEVKTVVGKVPSIVKDRWPLEQVLAKEVHHCLGLMGAR